MRNGLVKVINPKQFVENGVASSPNINNGYVGLLMLLNCPVREIFMTGINFYNFGNARGQRVGAKNINQITIDENKTLKYHKKYISYYDAAEHLDYAGNTNFTALHDQLSQIRYFRDVVIPGHPEVLRIDQALQDGLYTEELDRRLKWHETLPDYWT